MPRNTLLVVMMLAILAALVVGTNIGRMTAGTTLLPDTPPTPILPVATVTPPPLSYTDFEDAYCGISFTYPAGLNRIDAIASGSAVFAGSVQGSNSSLIVLCQETIPEPEGTIENNEFWVNNAVRKDYPARALLFSAVTPSTQEPVTSLYFRHPENGMDILVSGTTSVMEPIISTVHVTGELRPEEDTVTGY